MISSEEVGLGRAGGLFQHKAKAVCFPKLTYLALRQQVVIEVQGQSRFSRGLMP